MWTAERAGCGLFTGGLWLRLRDSWRRSANAGSALRCPGIRPDITWTGQAGPRTRGMCIPHHDHLLGASRFGGSVTASVHRVPSLTRDELAEMLRRYNPNRYGASLFRIYEDAQCILDGHGSSALGYELPTLEALTSAAKRPRDVPDLVAATSIASPAPQVARLSSAQSVRP
jgi:hypothetical protein